METKISEEKARKIDQIWQAKWPDWECVSQLGTGAFGNVYKCRHKQFGNEPEQLRAIKVIGTHSEAERDACINEIRIMLALGEEKNIVRIDEYTVIERAGDFWDICIRMELLTPLRDYIDRIGMENFTEKHVLLMGTQLCGALVRLSSKNIIHRDIKPDNIFFDEGTRLYKLGDFGIARSFSESRRTFTASTGTPLYMAPEVQSQHYTQNVDVYSLGIIMYRYLNHNRIPFMDKNTPVSNIMAQEKAYRIRMSGNIPMPAPDQASPEMAAVILKACAYDPKMRFKDADEFCLALLDVKKKTLLKGQARKSVQPVIKESPEKGITKTGRGGTKSSAQKAARSRQTPPPAFNQKKKKKLSKVPVIIVLALIFALVLIILKYGVFREQDVQIASETVSETVTESQTELQTEQVTEKPTEKQTEKQTEKMTEASTETEVLTEAHANGPAYAGVDIQATSKNDYTEYSARGGTLTMGGIKYDKGIEFACYDGCSVTYNLDRDYQHMSGMFGNAYISYDEGTKIRIYGDNTTQIGDLSIGSYDAPRPFTFNIEGFRQITFVCMDGSSSNHLGLANLVFYNDEDESPVVNMPSSFTIPAYCGKEIKAYRHSNYYTEYGDNGTDFTIGNTKYTKGYTNSSYQSYCFYYLNGQYKKLTGTMGLLSGINGSATYLIIADGTTIQRVELSPASSSVDINLDISGYNQIEIYGDAYDNFSNSEIVVGFGNMKFE